MLVSYSPGLSNESWSIMKNMATELCIILIGYFTLVPAIQVTQTIDLVLTEIYLNCRISKSI